MQEVFASAEWAQANAVHGSVFMGGCSGVRPDLADLVQGGGGALGSGLITVGRKGPSLNQAHNCGVAACQHGQPPQDVGVGLV